MKLSNKTIEAINGNGRIMNLIAAEFNCTESSVRRWILKNENNNLLTTVKALQIIEAETGLTEDEILTTETAA